MAAVLLLSHMYISNYIIQFALWHSALAIVTSCNWDFFREYLFMRPWCASNRVFTISFFHAQYHGVGRSARGGSYSPGLASSQLCDIQTYSNIGCPHQPLIPVM